MVCPINDFPYEKGKLSPSKNPFKGAITDATVDFLFDEINRTYNRPTDKQGASFLRKYGIECSKPLRVSSDLCTAMNLIHDNTERPISEKAVFAFFKKLAKNNNSYYNKLNPEEIDVVIRKLQRLGFDQKIIDVVRKIH